MAFISLRLVRIVILMVAKAAFVYSKFNVKYVIVTFLKYCELFNVIYVIKKSNLFRIYSSNQSLQP